MQIGWFFFVMWMTSHLSGLKAMSHSFSHSSCVFFQVCLKGTTVFLVRYGQIHEGVICKEPDVAFSSVLHVINVHDKEAGSLNLPLGDTR